jgi:nicotinate-nucleotide adenylyltransferase
LRLAQEATEHFQLSEVRFIPAGVPPHRAAPRTAAEHRAQMVELAIADNARFVLDRRELTKNVPCYTFDTLTELRAEQGNSAPIALIIGSDQFAVFDTWHRWRELCELAHLVVAHRPGHDLELRNKLNADVATLFGERGERESARLAQAPGGKIFRFAMTPLDISATRIRAEVRTGRSPRYLLPDAVLDYIQRHKIYLDSSI